MIDDNRTPPEIIQAFKKALNMSDADVVEPPPVFVAMQGEFVTYEENSKSLTVSFPVLSQYMNPYGLMQGGMIAAAVDNTVGPLSMLVAPPSFSRKLELKYKNAVKSDLDYIIVIADFLEQKKRQLYFSARVIDSSGLEYASATAMHWIVDDAYKIRTG